MIWCEICKNFDSKKRFCNTYDCHPLEHKIPVEESCNEFTLDKIKEAEESKPLKLLLSSFSVVGLIIGLPNSIKLETKNKELTEKLEIITPKNDKFMSIGGGFGSKLWNEFVEKKKSEKDIKAIQLKE